MTQDVHALWVKEWMVFLMRMNVAKGQQVIGSLSQNDQICR